MKFGGGAALKRARGQKRLGKIGKKKLGKAKVGKRKISGKGKGLTKKKGSYWMHQCNNSGQIHSSGKH